MRSGMAHPWTASTFAVAALLVQSTVAQAPQNGTLIFNATSDSSLSLFQGGNAANFTVALAGPPGTDDQKNYAWTTMHNATGIMTLIGGANYTGLGSAAGTIAYMSCDPDDYDTTLIGLPDIFASVVNTLHLQNPSPGQPSIGGILLYSKSANWCSVGASMANYNIFTMTSAFDSNRLWNSLANGSYGSQLSWIANTRFNNMSGTYSSDQYSTGSSSTTIAMIVLYTVTGIITFLFLLIIVLGAVRAHRHPERYGPRNILGMPRQSRARGMARALLDTIPIIKYGENEQPKPADGAHDVELGATSAANGHGPVTAVDGTPKQHEGGEDSHDAAKDGDTSASGMAPASDLTSTPSEAPGADTVRVEPGTTNAASPDDDSVQCPICTEDFVRGESARHLPCNHNFHPACIDPWLLNVSSTCPLCRIDLNPPSGAADTEETGADLQQPRSIRRSYVGRLHFLDLSNMRSATREERIEALRRVRDERAAREGNGEGGSRRARFSRLFQSNRQSRAISEEGDSAANRDAGSAQSTTSPNEPANEGHTDTQG